MKIELTKNLVVGYSVVLKKTIFEATCVEMGFVKIIVNGFDIFLQPGEFKIVLGESPESE